MHQLGYFGYLALKKPERVGVGHHHRSHRVVEQRAQVFHVDYALRRAFHLHHVEPADCCRGGVCAVRRVWHYHLGALRVAAPLVVAAYYHQARKLSVRPGEGVERELGQPGYFRQCALQPVVGFERPLAGVCRLQRVQVGKLRHGRHFLVDGRVVLHRAAAQRVEAVVHAEVVLAVVGVVAHYGHLVALRQHGVFLASHFGRHFVACKLVLRQRVGAPPLVRQLEYKVAV